MHKLTNYFDSLFERMTLLYQDETANLSASNILVTHENLILVLIWLVLCVAVVVAFAWILGKSFQAVVDNFLRVEGRGVIAGMIRVVISLIIIAVVFGLGAKSQALEFDSFKYVQADVGIVMTRNTSPQCVKNDSFSDKATSDLRLALNVFNISNTGRTLETELNVEYLHHSGVFCKDRYSFDSLGPKLILRWNF